MPAHDTYLEVRNVTKRYDTCLALDNVGFAAERGEFISILGPSGCGKTTMLRVVAGLEMQNEGEVRIDGRDVSGMPVSGRNVGIVFQSYALFPNLTAAANVAYGLMNQRVDKPKLRRRVDELLELVGLEGMGNKYPSQLSGGQQQRVALARAMALSPDLLLLDEPLSALDAKVRVKLRAEIRDLQQRMGVTTIMVTHDQEEALTMADRILVMDNGTVEQFGTPHEIYDRPATPFVASFIGSMNFLPNAVKEDRGLYRYGTVPLKADDVGRGVLVGKEAVIAIRPEDVMISNKDVRNSNSFSARVSHMEYRGSTFRVTLDPRGVGHSSPIEAEVAVEKAKRFELSEDSFVSVDLPEDRILVYPPDQKATPLGA